MHTHTHMHACTHTYIHTHTHAHTHTYTSTHTHTHTYTLSHIHSHTRTHTHTHTLTHTHTHTHSLSISLSHTHTHTQRKHMHIIDASQCEYVRSRMHQLVLPLIQLQDSPAKGPVGFGECVRGRQLVCKASREQAVPSPRVLSAATATTSSTRTCRASMRFEST